MNCPKCGDNDPIVIDSRQKPYGTRRRRECLVCGHRYSTVEVSVERYQLWQESEDLILNISQKIKTRDENFEN